MPAGQDMLSAAALLAVSPGSEGIVRESMRELVERGTESVVVLLDARHPGCGSFLTLPACFEEELAEVARLLNREAAGP